MSTPKPWINRKFPRGDGRCAIYIIVHLGYKSLRFNTGIACRLEVWDEVALRIRGTGKKAKDGNLIIEQCLARMNDIFVRYRLQNIQLTPELLKNEWKNPARRVDFFAFFEEAISERRKELAASTVRQHQSAIRILKKYRSSLAFSEITPDFLVSYQRWLKTQRGCAVNTVHSKLKVLRTYMNIAVRKGIIPGSPFENVKIKRTKANRVFLTSDELLKLWNMYERRTLNPTRQRVLAHFLFMCFTGIRISDLKTLRHSNIMDGMLVFSAQKTRHTKLELVRIPLNRYARQIIANETVPGRRFLFDTISEQRMNSYIKEIAAVAEINKKITNHSGRHTFATLWLAKTRDLAQLQSLLGHSNISETMVYVHIQAEDLHKRMQSFEEELFL